MDIVALFEDLVNGLLKAEEEFFSNPRDLYSLEKATKTTTDAIAAPNPMPLSLPCCKCPSPIGTRPRSN